MRYIGNKENLLDTIDTVLARHGVKGASFFDFFAGTTNVGRFFKKQGYQIFSSDVLYMSYCLQKAYIENNTIPSFERLCPYLEDYSDCSLFSTTFDKVRGYLNSLPGVEGFIYKNYTPGGSKELKQPRMYFSDENGKKIDAIRQKIESWKKEDLLTEAEYFVLLSCLIESVSFYSNVAGVYAAFSKKWDKRALKPLQLKEMSFIDNKKENVVYNIDSTQLLKDISVDILYLDPPYNARQYLPNYHILETIAKYDNPEIHGITGMREYSTEKSRFCNAITALEDLDLIAKTANYKNLVLSYNSEGIMPQEKIISILSKYGKTSLVEIEYARFKSNNQGLSKIKRKVHEQLYILQRD